MFAVDHREPSRLYDADHVSRFMGMDFTRNLPQPEVRSVPPPSHSCLNVVAGFGAWRDGHGDRHSRSHLVEVGRSARRRGPARELAGCGYSTLR